MRLQGTLAVCAAALLGAASWSLLEQLGPPPAADVARGSEEAFARDLYPRELLPGSGILRWTRPRALVEFRRVPEGPAELEVSIAGQRAPVDVSANGTLVVRLAVGERGGRYPIRVHRTGTVEVGLSGEGFRSGRELGVQLRRIALYSRSPQGLSPAWAPAVGAAVVAAAALAAGFGAWGAAAWGVASAAVGIAGLWPQGLVHSGYALTWALLQAVGGLLAGAFAAWQRRRGRGSGRWALGASLVAWWILVGAGTSPIMVVSDAVFHGNVLGVVARGELFPTSMTQHAEPFRIPYGSLFYALLTPLYAAGFDAVSLVRWGAALSCFAGCCGLFAALARNGAVAAGLSVLLLQAVPGWFDVLSHGNLSNAFGQALTLLFVAWALAGRSPILGALALAGASIGHLSSAIVAGGLAVGLVVASPREARGRLLRGVVPGLIVAGLYYLGFWSVVLEQLPRLLEGGGQGRGASRGAWGALSVQVSGALHEWGWPALILAGAHWRLRASRRSPLWSAFWVWGGLLAVAAVFSPLEVRYRYALTLPLAVAAASGLGELWSRGRAWRVIGVLLAASQLYLGLANVVEAVLWRYRA